MHTETKKQKGTNQEQDKLNIDRSTRRNLHVPICLSAQPHRNRSLFQTNKKQHSSYSQPKDENYK